jgi:dTDP-glucose 4,6-dehydratase
MDRILIIGSNSFSGASFASYILAKGLDVVGISRSPEPIAAMLPYKWEDHSRFTFFQLDLNRDLDSIMRVICDFRPSAVVNFAAQSMVEESWEHPEDWFQTNVVATIRLHDQLRRLDFLDKYVHVSTPEVYGSSSRPVHEDAPYNPTTPYAVSRAACDMSLMSFHKAHGFPVVITRAANVYGPGQQLYRIIPRSILFNTMGKRIPLHGGGTSCRSFIHIRDVAEGTWRVTCSGKPGEVYHLSTQEQISIRGLVKRICELLGSDFESSVEVVGERLGKDAKYILDSTKARESLGWKDSISLNSGLRETIEWIKRDFEVLKRQPLSYVHRK